MMNVKRMGFKNSRIMSNPHLRTQESFDPTFQFRPFKLYMITTQDDAYAITGEDGSDAVFLSKPDKKNKKQWVFIDSDTGAICFFHDLKSYMSINLVDGVVNVKRSDILLEGLFTFKQDGSIALKNKPKYLLAFKKIGGDTKKDKFTTYYGMPPVEEGFLASTWRAFKEGYNAATEPLLEAVLDDTIAKNPSSYSTTWKYVEIMDLRNITDNADTIDELTRVGSNKDTQVNALNKLIETSKQINDIELQYRDDKINGYEQNWFIKMFLAPKSSE